MGLVPPRILRPRAKPDYTLLEGTRAYGPVKQLSRPYGYQPSCPEPERNPPQSVSGIIPWDGRVTTQETADALMRMCVVSPREAAERLGIQPGPDGQSNRALLALMKTVESEISPESIDGIEPCGYEEL